MSTGGNENERELERNRAVTDSVHERLRTPQVHCTICNKSIPATDIARHFSPPHPSQKRCVYCDGQVFVYTSKSIDEFGHVAYNDEIYHRCP